MIPAAPSGWTLGFSGELVVYRDPSGGRIRCYQALPLASASALAVRIAASPIRTVERDVTAEGEYSALCTLLDGRTFAIVCGDHTAVAILGDNGAIVRELATSWRLSLGVRPRRVMYAPPPDWAPMTNDLTTSWFAPAFPSEGGVLVVYPAAPLGELPDDEVEHLLVLEGGARDLVRRPMETLHGLAGTVTTARLGDVHRALVVMKRAPYRYAVKLEARSPSAHRDVLAAVLGSIEPIPRATLAAQASAVAHWTE